MDPSRPPVFETDADAPSLTRHMLNWMYMCYMVAVLTLPHSVENVRFGRFCRAMVFGVRLEEESTLTTKYMTGFQALLSKLERLVGQAHYYPSLL